MSTAFLLQHDELYPAGRIASMFRDFGIKTELRRLHKGDAVPTDLSEARMLVLLGGAMRTADIGTDAKPFLAAEVAIAKQFVDQDRPILGVGFGAELLSIAGGAKVAENRKMPPPGPPPAPGTPPPPPGELAPEFGWIPVSFPFPGGTEPAVFGMVRQRAVLHLARRHVRAARLPAAARPAPAARSPADGQCRDGVDARLSHAGVQVQEPRVRVPVPPRARAGGHRADHRCAVEGNDARAEAVQVMRDDTAKYYSRYDRLGTKLITNLVQFLKTY